MTSEDIAGERIGARLACQFLRHDASFLPMTRIPMPLSSLLVALVALGCQGKQEAPPQDQAPQTKTAEPKKAAKEYPAPESFTLAPVAVGQWIRFSVEPKGAPPSQIFVRVVGKEGPAFWYEVESNTPNGTKVVQVLMEESAQKSRDKGAIQKLRIKADMGPVQEYAGPTLAAAKSVVDEYIEILGHPDPAKAGRADQTVTAGTFKGCFVQDVESPGSDLVTKEKTWRHPAVPITGFVRSEVVVNGRSVVQELLEVHETGAKSAL
jgi:hypothetical protein